MSKDVIIAGSIAVGCIALIAVAFIAPKGKPPVESESTKTETITAINDGGNGFNGLENGGSNGNFGLPPSYPPTGAGLPQVIPPDNFGGLPPGGNYAPVGNSPPPGNMPPTQSNMPFGQLPGPAVTPVEAPPVVTESKSHTVASGEYLSDIAVKYYGSAKSWKKIQEANPGLDPKNLKVGQKLVIPVEAKSGAESGTAVTPGVGERTYTIKTGDSLYVIAKRELGSASRWKELEKLNNVSSGDLRVGQVIKLPAEASASPVAPNQDTVSAGTKSHTVGKGETLSDISKTYYGTTRNWKKIEAANPGVTSDNLKIGQKLVIPEIAGATLESPSGSPVSSGEYTVKKGDTLGSIALSELGAKSRSKELQDANPGLDSRNLRIGQKIKIPGKKSEPVEPFNNSNPIDPVPFGSPNRPIAPPANPPFGAPPAMNPPPTFPGTDSGFNSPYNNNGNGAGFGQPNPPFGQTNSSFGQTGTSTIPSSDPFGVPSQTSPFTPTPPSQPVR